MTYSCELNCDQLQNVLKFNQNNWTSEQAKMTVKDKTAEKLAKNVKHDNQGITIIKISLMLKHYKSQIITIIKTSQCLV